MSLYNNITYIALTTVTMLSVTVEHTTAIGTLNQARVI